MDIRHELDKRIAAWEYVGFSAPIERFVSRNGVVMPAGPPPARTMAANECFRNAALIASKDPAATYVEGFATKPDIHGLLLQHAWVEVDGVVVDPTWTRPDSALYIGVRVPTATLCRVLVQRKVYGLFSDGIRINTDLLFEIDPGLRPIVEAIEQRPVGGLRDRDIA